MTNNKKMINTFIILGFIGGILVAISIAGYRIYSGKENIKKEQNAIKERNEINNNVSKTKDSLRKDIEKIGSKVNDKVDSAKEEIIDNENTNLEKTTQNIEKSTNKIISKNDQNTEILNKNQKEILSGINDLKNPPRNPNGLYRNGEKKGTASNFIKNGNTFTMDKVDYDKPMESMNEIFTPFEYKNYVIKIEEVNTLTLMFPARATGIKGTILKEN